MRGMGPTARRLRHHLAAAPALAASRSLTIGVAALVYAILVASIVGSIGAELPGGALYRRGDFFTMWDAGQLLRAGHAAVLYHRPAFDLWLQQVRGGGLPDESWLYTPPMGLAAMLVSLAPLPSAFWAWRAATLALAATLLRACGLRWWVICAGLLGPAEAYDLLLGQNGALTAGLLVASLLGLEKRPIGAGVLAGCLIIKPQIAVLLPFILGRPRFWRVVLACAASATALAVLAVLIEGPAAWRLFIVLAEPNAARIQRLPFGADFQMSTFTVFWMARSLHAGLGAAYAVQGFSSLAAAAGCWRLWRRPVADPVARMAATICLTMLAMPYGFSYDLVVFSVAMVALGARARAWELPVLAGLWFWPCLATPLTLATHIEFLPLAALTGLAVSLRRVAHPRIVPSPPHPKTASAPRPARSDSSTARSPRTDPPEHRPATNG